MEGHESQRSSDGECLDEVFAALGHRHRRRVLDRLLDRESVDVEELLEDDDEVGEPDSVAVELHHAHLPTLDQAGLVEWDRESRVSRGPKFEAVEGLIELFSDHQDRLPGEWP